MVTKNYKQFLAILLQTSSSICVSGLRMQDVKGFMRYASGYESSPAGSYKDDHFPGRITDTYTLNRFDPGIAIGRGSTAPTEYDWNLEDTITSGVMIQKISHVPGIDSEGCPYLRYTFTVTNTDIETLVIREVGYKQRVSVCVTPGRTTNLDNDVFLFDRTLLETPLVIEPGDAGVLVYTLKTIPRREQTIGGVEVVGFDWGTDEQIAAILDAATAGRVDLQRDIGWRVGDVRKIHLEPFTDGADVTHAAQDIDIVITSFDEYYEGLGNILQFDFLEALETGVRYHSTYNYTGGYGGTEMYLETLPALVEALPAWMRGRLKTFDAVTATGYGASSTEAVPNNKLALRSEMEVFGFLDKAALAEGAQVDWYKNYNAHIKRRGYSGISNYWWLRSPVRADISGAYPYLSVTTDSIDSTNDKTSVRYGSSTNGVAPFGCI